LSEFRRGIDSLIEELFGDGSGTELVEGFVPRANVAETDSAYEITVDLPGMKPEDLNVELKGGELWISGERKHEKEEKGKTFHRIEKRYGRFHRAIPLAAALNENKIEAEYKNGVLQVTALKAEEAKPKRIQVKAWRLLGGYVAASTGHGPALPVPPYRWPSSP
jgi:HSP20 family protein